MVSVSAEEGYWSPFRGAGFLHKMGRAGCLWKHQWDGGVRGESVKSYLIRRQRFWWPSDGCRLPVGGRGESPHVRCAEWLHVGWGTGSPVGTKGRCTACQGASEPTGEKEAVYHHRWYDPLWVVKPQHEVEGASWWDTKVVTAAPQVDTGAKAVCGAVCRECGWERWREHPHGDW